MNNFQLRMKLQNLTHAYLHNNAVAIKERHTSAKVTAD